MEHHQPGIPPSSGVHPARQAVHRQPVLGLLVRIAEVEVVVVQPARHVRPSDEAQVQPVVSHATAGSLAVVKAEFITAGRPVQADEAP